MVFEALDCVSSLVVLPFEDGHRLLQGSRGVSLMGSRYKPSLHTLSEGPTNGLRQGVPFLIGEFQALSNRERPNLLGEG